jgi:hypothetical protein
VPPVELRRARFSHYRIDTSSWIALSDGSASTEAALSRCASGHGGGAQPACHEVGRGQLAVYANLHLASVHTVDGVCAFRASSRWQHDADARQLFEPRAGDDHSRSVRHFSADSLRRHRRSTEAVPSRAGAARARRGNIAPRGQRRAASYLPSPSP